jgi:hypothetical protein
MTRYTIIPNLGLSTSSRARTTFGYGIMLKAIDAAETLRYQVLASTTKSSYAARGADAVAYLNMSFGAGLWTDAT